MLDDPSCRPAVPFRRDRTFFPLACHQSCERRRQLVRIGAYEVIRADRNGLGPFGVIAAFATPVKRISYLVSDQTLGRDERRDTRFERRMKRTDFLSILLEHPSVIPRVQLVDFERTHVRSPPRNLLEQLKSF